MHFRNIGRNLNLENIGNRNKNVWDGEPEGVYIPVNEVAEIGQISAVRVVNATIHSLIGEIAS